ncbi:hypothetical protein BN946_scf184935.g17 [Trametes cinnabarina]|uniref:WD40 repeat-like protein n=1 Tax=Pycnoporus cinnabarinus TaxID=5643 RepID=A0A060SMR8_PYCCI|nr:hypothetical protein BN946_scf184935.g17 [Trametes cinnabarina]
MDNDEQGYNSSAQAQQSQSGLHEILSGDDASSRERLQRILDAILELQGVQTVGSDGERISATLTIDDLQRLMQLFGAGSGRAGSVEPVANEVDDEENDPDYVDEEEEDEDEDEVIEYWGVGAHTQWDRTRDWWPQVTEPKEEGMSLLMSGEFGRVLHQLKSRSERKNVARNLLNRATSARPTYREDIASDILPNSSGTAVAAYPANAYVGQFSSDSAFYYTCVRNFRLHVYDMKAPFRQQSPSRPQRQEYDDGHTTIMQVIKTIQAAPGRWTITDSHLSPDNQRMIYASISSTVYMTSTLDSSTEQIPISFKDPTPQRIRRGMTVWDDDDQFGIWSCKFSADGKEVIAGGSSMIFGITYVSAKGDGRYVISNGKDQILRLWDLRMMRSNSEFESVAKQHYGIPHFDYRGENYPRPRFKAHPLDCSVMKYTGHEVLRTLIRCHFSPAETTGQQYIYSGSSDGRIHIWSLDGRIVEVLDRSYTLPMALDPSGPEPADITPARVKPCVRDVSWHSQQPILMSTGWLGRRWGLSEGSVIARHEFKGLSKLRGSLEDFVAKERAERPERARRPASAQLGMPGAFTDDAFGDIDTSDGETTLHRYVVPPRLEFGSALWLYIALSSCLHRPKHPKAPIFFTMVITGEEELKTEIKMDDTIPPLSVELKSYGFPHGYFMLRSVGTERILDVSRGSIEDGTDVILWPPTDTSQVESMRRAESNNQVFFIDTSGALSSRHSGHAIDVEKEKLVLRHRRPVSHPFPNAYSHPLPRFVYHPETKEITIVFGGGSTDTATRRSSTSSVWKERIYYLTSVPVRRPPSLMANASTMLNTAIAGPLSFFGGKAASNATPEHVFDGEIDLTENEIAEQDRNEAEEIDDSADALRPVKVIALTAEEAANASEQAKLRRQWEILPLRISKHRTGMPSQ